MAIKNPSFGIYTDADMDIPPITGYHNNPCLDREIEAQARRKNLSHKCYRTRPRAKIKRKDE